MGCHFLRHYVGGNLKYSRSWVRIFSVKYWVRYSQSWKLFSLLLSGAFLISLRQFYLMHVQVLNSKDPLFRSFKLAPSFWATPFSLVLSHTNSSHWLFWTLVSSFSTHQDHKGRGVYVGRDDGSWWENKRVVRRALSIGLDLSPLASWSWEGDNLSFPP